MSKKLVTTVHVYQRDSSGTPLGTPHVFGPGQVPPPWAQQAITNPACWGRDDSPSAEELYAAQTGTVPIPQREAVTLPKGGYGASRDVWATYAAAAGVPVGAEASRDEVIAACQAAGVGLR